MRPAGLPSLRCVSKLPVAVTMASHNGRALTTGYVLVSGVFVVFQPSPRRCFSHIVKSSTKVMLLVHQCCQLLRPWYGAFIARAQPWRWDCELPVVVNHQGAALATTPAPCRPVVLRRSDRLEVKIINAQSKNYLANSQSCVIIWVVNVT